MCKLHITRNGFSFFYDVLCFFRKRILRDTSRTIRIFLILQRIYISYHIIYDTCILKKYFIKILRNVFFYITFFKIWKICHTRLYVFLSLSLSLILHCMFFFIYNFFCCVFFGEFKNSSARFAIRRISVLVEIPGVRAVNLHIPNLRGNS